MEWLEYSSDKKLAEGLCEFVNAQIKYSLKTNERAVLVLSGGRTPNLYLPILFTLNLPWENIDITFSDERWVSPDHINSNEGLVKKYLSSSIAKGTNIISLWGNEKNPDLAIEKN